MFELEDRIWIDHSTRVESKLFRSNAPLWSDLRTTYRLLPVGNGPDEAVEVSGTGWPKIKVLYNSPQDLGVSLGQPLGVRFDLSFPSDVLLQETQHIHFFRCDQSQTPLGRCHDSQRERQNHKGSRDHPWGRECWVIASKIAEF